MNREAWRAIVRGVMKSRTRLSMHTQAHTRVHTHTHIHMCIQPPAVQKGCEKVALLNIGRKQDGT